MYIGVMEKKMETTIMSYIGVIYMSCTSFHFIFHYPYITRIYYSSCHLIFHYPYITSIFQPKQDEYDNALSERVPQAGDLLERVLFMEIIAHYGYIRGSLGFSTLLVGFSSCYDWVQMQRS